MFGNIFKQMEKNRKRMVLSNNRFSGKMAEDNFVLSRSIQGYEVERTGRGHDFVERRVNPFTGRKGPRTFVEVKSSRKAPLSDLQKKKKRSMRNYRVERGGWF